MYFKIFLIQFLMVIGLSSDTPIAWTENFKLSWDHFKGPAQTNVDAAAVTASGITFSYSLQRSNNAIVGFNAVVEAHFYPDHSWYVKDKIDDYILAHEQLHFDITELHVRKLRKKIAELQVNPSIKSQLDQLHISEKENLRSMQKLYDKESENSINRENQLKWYNFVQQELTKFKEFSSR